MMKAELQKIGFHGYIRLLQLGVRTDTYFSKDYKRCQRVCIYVAFAYPQKIL